MTSKNTTQYVLDKQTHISYKVSKTCTVHYPPTNNCR